MRRRSRASSEPSKARRRKANTPKRRTAPKAVVRRSPPASRETEVARLARERDEALERETASAEVLKVISSSPGELELVFQAMLENATRVCAATSGLLVRAENDGFRIAASLRQRANIEDMKHRTFKFGPSTPIGRAVRTRQIVHVANLAEDRAYLEREPLAVWAVEQANVRTVLVVPMLKRQELVGIFGIERDEVRPFTDKQIELVKNFAPRPSSPSRTRDRSRICGKASTVRLRQLTSFGSSPVHPKTASALSTQLPKQPPGCSMSPTSTSGV
jgi:hypothetical protein